MGLPVAVTRHENDNLVIQDSTEVCEMLTAPASAAFSYFLSFLGSKKPLSRCLCEQPAGLPTGNTIMKIIPGFHLMSQHCIQQVHC